MVGRHAKLLSSLNLFLRLQTKTATATVTKNRRLAAATTAAAESIIQKLRFMASQRQQDLVAREADDRWLNALIPMIA